MAAPVAAAGAAAAKTGAGAAAKSGAAAGSGQPLPAGPGAGGRRHGGRSHGGGGRGLGNPHTAAARMGAQALGEVLSPPATEPDGSGGTAAIAVGLPVGLMVSLFLILVLLPVLLLTGIFGDPEPSCMEQGCAPAGQLPAGARAFRAIYADAAQAFGVNQFVLMAIHESESQYGQGSGAGIKTGKNSDAYGGGGCCAGPMQFWIDGAATPEQGGAGGTWAAYKDSFEDDRLERKRPGVYPNRFTQPEYPRPNVYDSYDAITAAAAYLEDLEVGPMLDDRTLRALIRYKGETAARHPNATATLDRAKALQQLAQQADFSGPLPDGPRGAIDPNTGDAAPPASAPEQVVGMYRAANAINDKPYVLRHYPSHIDAPTYDCSSSTSHVLWGGGLFGKAPWVSSSFLNWGSPGPGKWVTVWVRPGVGAGGHVFVVVGGLRFDTSRWNGDNAVPAGSGPRWTANVKGPVKQMQAQGFIPRHPPGL